MTIAAGSLNRRLRIERRVTGTDAAGQPLDSWEMVDEVWARPIGQTGMGAIRQGGLQENIESSINAYSWRIRYRDGFDAGMRALEVRNGVPFGMPFDIKLVRMDLELREWTDLVCEQGGSAG